MLLKLLIFLSLFKNSIENGFCQYHSPCETSYSINGCSIYCNEPISSFPLKAESNLTKIYEFTLRETNEISENAFLNLKIFRLNIYGEKLNKISTEAFRGVNEVSGLYLYDMKNLDLLFSDENLLYLKDTKIIHFINSYITDEKAIFLLDQIKQLKQLAQIGLEFNLLSNFKYDFVNFPNLNTLNLSNNFIETFNVNSSTLNSINLAYNKIEYLSSSMFKYIPNLSTLDVKYNSIETFSNEAFLYLKSLKYFNLNNNNINEIEINSSIIIQSYQYIDLSNNKIEALPKNFGQFIKNVFYLDLSNNHIKNVTFLSEKELPSLIHFSLTNNRIESITIDILEKIKNIFFLDLSKNLIEQIKFPKMIRLSKITLNRNRLKQINKNDFNKLENLNTLYLNDNRIRKFEPNSFKLNTNLEILDLSNNYLSSINGISVPEYLNLKNQNGYLKKLNDNTFQYILNELSNQTTEIILNENKITEFKNNVFCSSISNELFRKKVLIYIDDLNYIQPCILAQLKYQDISFLTKKPVSCSIRSIAEKYKINIIDEDSNSLFCDNFTLSASDNCSDVSNYKYICLNEMTKEMIDDMKKYMILNEFNNSNKSLEKIDDSKLIDITSDYDSNEISQTIVDDDFNIVNSTQTMINFSINFTDLFETKNVTNNNTEYIKDNKESLNETFCNSCYHDTFNMLNTTVNLTNMTEELVSDKPNTLMLQNNTNIAIIEIINITTKSSQINFNLPKKAFNNSFKNSFIHQVNSNNTLNNEDKLNHTIFTNQSNSIFIHSNVSNLFNKTISINKLDLLSENSPMFNSTNAQILSKKAKPPKRIISFKTSTTYFCSSTKIFISIKHIPNILKLISNLLLINFLK